MVDVDCCGSVNLKYDPHHKGHYAERYVIYKDDPNGSIVGLCMDCYVADKGLYIDLPLEAHKYCPKGCGPLKYKRIQYLVGGRKAYYYYCPVCGFERRDISKDTPK